jgi:hypothetical protein
MLFWTKGAATAEGQVPLLPTRFKFAGAAAIFVVVLLLFHFINPIKPFSDYKSILVLSSNEEHLSSPTDATQFKIDRSTIKVDDKEIPFDKTLQIQMTSDDSTYTLLPQLTTNSFGTRQAIPKGSYTIWFISSATGKSRYYQIEVK